MTKKIALLLNFILLAGCLFYFIGKPMLLGPVDYERGSGEEIRELLETGTPAEKVFFTELAFSDEVLPFDKATSTFYLPLNMETEKWETGRLTSEQEDVRLLFADAVGAEDKQEAIRAGRRYRFYAVRGSEYQECYLAVTGLPIVSIETAEDADTEAFGGTAYFWDSESKFHWTSSSILEAHIRGNTSRTYPKKGYRLTLKKQDKDGNIVPDKKQLFGLREDDEWILNALYSDSSKIRDKLSIDVWNSFGASAEEFPNARFGTNFTYVELFFNDEYRGLYGLMEPVDSKQLDLARESRGEIPEYAYKAVVTQQLSTEELDAVEDFSGNVAGFELKGSYSAVTAENWKPLFDYLKLRDLADNETFREKAPVLADQENALNVWMYFQAVLGIDNRAKNIYYVAKRENSSYRIYFAPWDMDLTWGDCLTEGTGERIWDVELLTALYSERINWSFGDRLVELNVNDSAGYIERTWEELREGALSDEALSGSIDGLVHQVRDSGALERNEERWPDSNTGQDYDQFKRLALYRMHILDYYFGGNLSAYMGVGYE